MNTILDKCESEITKKSKALKCKIDSSLQHNQDPASQPETFTSILKTALEKSKKDQGNTCDSSIKINAFGKGRTDRNQQVLVVKPKVIGPVDAARVATITNSIEKLSNQYQLIAF